MSRPSADASYSLGPVASDSDTSAVDVVRKLFAEVERGEVESLEMRLTEDVVWRLPKTGRLRRTKVIARGPEQVAPALSANYGTVVADVLGGAGDRVMVVLRWVRVEAQNAPVVYQVLTVRDGKIAELHDYHDRDEAVAALGREPSE